MLLEQSRESNRAISGQLLQTRIKAPLETFDATVEALRLPDPPAPKPSPEMISTSRLMHKVPKAAKKEFDKATKLIKKKRYTEAAVLLEKAIAIDPEFADAHNDLGAQYMALGRVAEAEPHFRKAVELDTAFAVARANLAVSEYMRGDWDGAERDAQRALSYAPSNQASRQVLNLIRAKRAQ